MGGRRCGGGADRLCRLRDRARAVASREPEHGGRFSYRSIETDGLAFVLERATDKHCALLLSDELWQKLGMEADGCTTVDASGFALADGGLNADTIDVVNNTYVEQITADAKAAIDKASEMGFVDPGTNAVGFEIDACLPARGGGIACANDVGTR